jgi:hypothetical protein
MANLIQTNISKNDLPNIGQIKNISIIEQTRINTISIPNPNNEISISFSGGYNWNNIYFTPGTSNFSCNHNLTENNYNFKLSFSIPKIRTDVVNFIKKFQGKKLIVKYTDKNNSTYLAGDQNQFCLLSSKPIITNNNNAIEFTIFSKLLFYPYFLKNQ